VRLDFAGHLDVTLNVEFEALAGATDAFTFGLVKEIASVKRG
jgi:hypothetical protein